MNLIVRKTILRLALAFVACVAGLPFMAMAQDLSETIESSFRRIDPAEETKLNALLAEPVPTGAEQRVLDEHMRQKYLAARRLGNAAQTEAVLRQAITLTKANDYRNNLGYVELARGNIEAGNKWIEEARDLITNNPSYRHMYDSKIAVNLASQGRIEEAQNLQNQVKADNLKLWKEVKQDWQRRNLSRALLFVELVDQIIANKKGDSKAALAAARRRKHQSWITLGYLSGTAEREHIYFHEDLVDATKSLIEEQRIAGRFWEAEATLAELFQLTKQYELPPGYRAGNYHVASVLKFWQRDFVVGEKLMRESDRIVAEMGRAPLSADRINKANYISINLQGQKRWVEALAQYEDLKALAKTTADLQRLDRVHLLDRGKAYLHNGRFADATTLFDRSARSQNSNYAENHFFRVQARGLQGVALWRLATPESKAQAAELLKNAVRDYMLPQNAEYLDGLGLRPYRRELIFATYLESLAAGHSAQSPIGLEGFGAADWVRGSHVQEALADAALRASVTDPRIADLVRREQDAKNEINALRSSLSGESGSLNLLSAEISAKMRTRITQLETDRANLQAQIKRQFPEYEQLLRPAVVKHTDVQAKLGASDAFLSILPTDAGTYLWVITKEGAQFHKSTLTGAEVSQMVKRIRATLDVAGESRLPAFDAARSAKLYDELVRPFAAMLAGKPHVVVAAGGALGQMPMGVLLSAPQATPQNYWITKTAITHVPSATAWLAVRQSTNTGAAKEAFFGVGDPVFSVQAAAANALAANTASQTVRNVNLQRNGTSNDFEKPQQSAVRYGTLSPLPETRDEIKAIALALKADDSKDTLFGVNANKVEVMRLNTSGNLKTKRVLSFATHGLVAGDLPNLNQPALALSVPKDFDEKNVDPENVAKPLLTLEDVLGLKLNADWVVLSACNTAAADGKGEEALSGLARGFFYAGAKSVLATHWAVESESAAALTTATFAHYTANQQAPKAESLRSAMLKVMSDTKNKHWAHPAFWAPFALVGDGGR